MNWSQLWLWPEAQGLPGQFVEVAETTDRPQAEAGKKVEKEGEFLPLHWSHIWAYSDKTIAPIRTRSKL